jgi:hypothetical protein
VWTETVNETQKSLSYIAATPPPPLHHFSVDAVVVPAYPALPDTACMPACLLAQHTVTQAGAACLLLALGAPVLALRRSGPAAPRFTASTGAPAAVGVPLSVVVWCLLGLPRPPEQRFRFSGGRIGESPAGLDYLAIVFSVLGEIWEGQCCFLLGVCAALL